MAGMSQYLENVVINHLLRNQPFTPPAQLYLALFTTAPTDTAPGTEPSGGGYARQPFAFGPPTGNPARASNTADILFPVATAPWGTVTHVGIFDAATGGNMLGWAPLSASANIQVNDQLKIPAGQLTWQQD